MADLPPSYSEVIGEIGPPPAYSESEPPNNNAQFAGSQENPTVAWPECPVITLQPGINTSQNPGGQTIIRTQPSTGNDVLSQQRGKAISCNCFCAACKWRPCTANGECFCYHSIGFLFYCLFCVPSVLACMACEKICPESYGDCPNREWELIESYHDRQTDICRQCCWLMCGPLCCYTCDSATDVCPLATPCVSRFGMNGCRKLTCYCSRATLNCLDRQAFKFICNVRDCGCDYAESAYL